MSEDSKISQHYRELPREEPPRHLDQAILAAARRAAETRPAPLVVPSGRRRWYFPLAAAAIIVLAVAVTVHVDRQQQRDIELAEAPVTAPAQPPVEKAETKREGFVAEPQPAPAKERHEAPAAEAPARAAPAPAPTSPPVAAQRQERARVQGAPAPGLRQDQEAAATAEGRATDDLRMQRREQPPQAQRAPAAEPPVPQAPVEDRKARAELRRADEAQRPSSVMAKVGARSPEQWLQGIADLRRQGRHDEADKELGEFRRAYPDYKIPEAMLGKVERPK